METKLNATDKIASIAITIVSEAGWIVFIELPLRLSCESRLRCTMPHLLFVPNFLRCSVPIDAMHLQAGPSMPIVLAA